MPRVAQATHEATGRATGTLYSSSLTLSLPRLGALDMGQTELDRESTWNAAAGPHSGKKATGLPL